MPPKAKFTKQQIAEAGLDIIRNEGMNNLTARSLGKKLGSSACPIFTVFENMEAVQAEIKIMAKALYSKYVERGLKENPAFKGVGIQYILFAIQEPKLFQLLFMSEQPQQQPITNVLPFIEDNYEEIMNSVKSCYSLNTEDAERLYRHLWVYTHGIAVLCATNMCLFTDKEIGHMMSEAFNGILKEIKNS